MKFLGFSEGNMKVVFVAEKMKYVLPGLFRDLG